MSIPLDRFHQMSRELAEAAVMRFYSAQREGKSDVDAMQEIIETVIKTYGEALSS